MRHTANIAKRDSAQQLVLVEIYVPNEIDSQGEFVTPATLEKAAHAFSEGGNHKNVSVMHNGKRIDATVVESYIAKKGDKMFKAGSWIAVIKIRDQNVWADIEKGVLKGVSFEGVGHTREATVNGKKAREIIDLTVETISLVDRPANRKPFKMTKSDQQDLIYKLSPELAKLKMRMEAIEKSVDTNTGLLAEVPTAVVNAEIAATAVREAIEAGRLRREHSTISDSLFKLQPGTLAHRLAHDRYQLRLIDIETELEVFAKGEDELRHHDAFLHSGGSSAFLRASASDEELTGMNAFGIKTGQNISKDEDIPLSHNNITAGTGNDADNIDLNSGFKL